MTKKATSVRVSEEARVLLRKLSKKLGVSQAAIMEIAVRDLAKREGVSLDA